MKKFAISVGIGISLIVLLFGAFFWKMKSEISFMTPTETGPVIPGILAVHDSFVNLFLLENNGRYIAIDSGNDPEVVRRELKNLSIDPKQVDAVFLTHSDSDHVAAVKEFANATVYLPELEVRMIDGSTNRFLFLKNSLDVNYNTVKDGQRFTFDNIGIECVSTTGHTPGSMSFLVNGKYLFVGDTLSIIDGRVDLFNDFFNMDSKTQTESIREIAKLNAVTHILSAHYGVIEINNDTFSKFR